MRSFAALIVNATTFTRKMLKRLWSSSHRGHCLVRELRERKIADQNGKEEQNIFSLEASYSFPRGEKLTRISTCPEKGSCIDGEERILRLPASILSTKLSLFSSLLFFIVSFVALCSSDIGTYVYIKTAFYRRKFITLKMERPSKITRGSAQCCLTGCSTYVVKYSKSRNLFLECEKHRYVPALRTF